MWWLKSQTGTGKTFLSLSFSLFLLIMDYSNVNYQYLEDSLCNTSGKVELAERFRSLFTLKNIANDQAIDIIAKGITNTHLKLYLPVLNNSPQG